MIYEKIRHAKKIRILSKSRQQLTHDRRPNFSAKMGYRKYSSSYYLLNKKLKTEGILDWDGRFIGTITNDWLAEIPMYAKPEELHALGFKPTFDLYLSLIFRDSLRTDQMIQGLETSPASVYTGIKKLANLSLIHLKGSTAQINKATGVFGWMMKYLKLAMIQADMNKSLTLLFDCVPGYIDGPQAYALTHYEPGRPIGLYSMIVRTSPFFEPFWQLAVNNMEYFAARRRKIAVLYSTDDADLAWINGLPYNKNSTEDF